MRQCVCQVSNAAEIQQPGPGLTLLGSVGAEHLMWQADAARPVPV